MPRNRRQGTADVPKTTSFTTLIFGRVVQKPCDRFGLRATRFDGHQRGLIAGH